MSAAMIECQPEQGTHQEEGAAGRKVERRNKGRREQKLVIHVLALRPYQQFQVEHQGFYLAPQLFFIGTHRGADAGLVQEAPHQGHIARSDQSQHPV